MKVYVDLIFISDYIMDLLALKIVSLISHKKTSMLRLFLASFLAAACAVIYNVAGLYQMRIVWRIIIAMTLAAVMVRIAFSPIHSREYLYLLFLFLMGSFCLEGITECFEQWILSKWQRGRSQGRTLLYFIGFVSMGYGFLKRLFFMKESREKEKIISMTEITIGNEKAKAMALLDSGNSLIEPITKKPVVIAEQTLFTKTENEKGYFIIPYRALGNEGDYMKGILADEVKVKTKEGEDVYNKVMIGLYEGQLSRQGTYRILLHPGLTNHAL